MSRSARQSARVFVEFSIDINTSSLGTRAGNAYELNFRYFLPIVPWLLGQQRNANAKKLLDCKDFLF